MTPVALALTAQKGFRSFGVFSHGFLAGLAFWQLIMVLTLKIIQMGDCVFPYSGCFWIWGGNSRNMDHPCIYCLYNVKCSLPKKTMAILYSLISQSGSVGDTSCLILSLLLLSASGAIGLGGWN